MWKKAQSFKLKLSKGQTMAEYALIVAFVAIAAWASYQGLGHSLKQMADSTANFVTNVLG